MAPAAAWLVANATTISAVSAVASTAYSASEAHQARKGARGVAQAQAGAMALAESARKRARKTQEGILRDRAQDRRRGGLLSTISPGTGSRTLGGSNTGGKSLLG